MSAPNALIDDFLAQKRIAVAGVSREHDHFANGIFERLRATGHEVIPMNPRASEVEGQPCYPDLTSIPGGVDAVLIATPPAAAEAIVRQCIDLGITHVWMHRSFGDGSVSEHAVDLCHQHHIDVIVGGCPMMYCGNIDFGHRCMRWILNATGRIAS